MELLATHQSSLSKNNHTLNKAIQFSAPAIKKFETSEFNNATLRLFVPVSITGSSCELGCQHCRAQILKSMYATKTPKELFDLAFRLKGRKGSGLLVSGGADRRGLVPLSPFIPVLKEIKERLRLKVVVHIGLVNEEIAQGLGEVNIDAAMLDIIGSNKTIKRVCHLNATVEDYEESLRLLANNKVKISPHVVIGLDYGRIEGEKKALEIISQFEISSLVLVILNPLLNTPMENVKAPSPEKVREIFLFARQTFPQIPILLGCARPAGKYRMQVDKFAIDAGLNGIAYPSEGMVNYAMQQGLRPLFSGDCCALVNPKLRLI